MWTVPAFSSNHRRNSHEDSLCGIRMRPFHYRTGGLAGVVGALSPVLKAQGRGRARHPAAVRRHSEQYVSQMKLECEFEVELCWRRQYCGIKSLEYQGVTFYFVDNQYYFGRSYIYGLGGDEYERFGFFDRAVIDALVHLDFKPDVIHCHDWQTGMIPALLKIQYAQFRSIRI